MAGPWRWPSVFLGGCCAWFRSGGTALPAVAHDLRTSSGDCTSARTRGLLKPRSGGAWRGRVPRRSVGSVGQGVAGLLDGLADLLGRHGLLGGDPDLARGEVDLDIGDALDGREFLGH